MYRIVELSGIFYATELEGNNLFELTDEDINNIDSFIAEDKPITICNNIEDFQDTFAIKVKLI